MLPSDVWTLVLACEPATPPWLCPALRLTCRAGDRAVCKCAPHTVAGRAWLFGLLFSARHAEPRALPEWIPADGDPRWVALLCRENMRHLAPTDRRALQWDALAAGQCCRMSADRVLGALRWDARALGSHLWRHVRIAGVADYRATERRIDQWGASCLVPHLAAMGLERTLSALPWDRAPARALLTWWLAATADDPLGPAARAYAAVLAGARDDLGIFAHFFERAPIADVDGCLVFLGEFLASHPDDGVSEPVTAAYFGCRAQILLADKPTRGRLCCALNAVARQVGLALAQSRVDPVVVDGGACEPAPEACDCCPATPMADD